MTTKPTDQDRLNFLTHFRCSLEFDYAIGMWSIKMAKGRSLGSTPRKAIDEAIKWTRDRSKS